MDRDSGGSNLKSLVTRWWEKWGSIPPPMLSLGVSCGLLMVPRACLPVCPILEVCLSLVSWHRGHWSGCGCGWTLGRGANFYFCSWAELDPLGLSLGPAQDEQSAEG